MVPNLTHNVVFSCGGTLELVLIVIDGRPDRGGQIVRTSNRNGCVVDTSESRQKLCGRLDIAGGIIGKDGQGSTGKIELSIPGSVGLLENITVILTHTCGRPFPVWCELLLAKLFRCHIPITNCRKVLPDSIYKVVAIQEIPGGEKNSGHNKDGGTNGALIAT